MLSMRKHLVAILVLVDYPFGAAKAAGIKPQPYYRVAILVLVDYPFGD